MHCKRKIKTISIMFFFLTWLRHCSARIAPMQWGNMVVRAWHQNWTKAPCGWYWHTVIPGTALSQAHHALKIFQYTKNPHCRFHCSVVHKAANLNNLHVWSRERKSYALQYGNSETRVNSFLLTLMRIYKVFAFSTVPARAPQEGKVYYLQICSCSFRSHKG